MRSVERVRWRERKNESALRLWVLAVLQNNSEFHFNCWRILELGYEGIPFELFPSSLLFFFSIAHCALLTSAIEKIWSEKEVRKKVYRKTGTKWNETAQLRSICVYVDGKWTKQCIFRCCVFLECDRIFQLLGSCQFCMAIHLSWADSPNRTLPECGPPKSAVLSMTKSTRHTV